MDDDSCVMKYIEIVPLNRSTDSPELPDVKHPVQVKVCIFTLGVTYFFGLVFTLYGFGVVNRKCMRPESFYSSNVI